jgi:copper transport protein
VLNWRVVSLDSHPVAGALAFSIGARSGDGAAVPENDPLASAALWASRALLLAALLFGVGGAGFSLVAPLPQAGARIAGTLAALGLGIAPLTLGLHGLDALGLGLADLMTAEPWLAGFSTRDGLTVLAAMLAFALALAGLRPGWAGAALAGLAAAAIALALSGHAGSAEPQALTRPAVALHIAGLLFWAGALVPLLLLLADKSVAADRALLRFSRLAPFPVAAILLSGATLTAVQLGPPGPDWVSAYGAILAGKIGLLIPLFALAGWNRFGLTRPALAGDGAARRNLRRSIVAEIGLMLAILLLVAGWRFTPPPRALAQPSAAARVEPLHAHAMDDKVMADILVTPGAAGPVALEIFLGDPEGEPIVPLAVAATLSSPALGIEAVRYEAMPDDGVWRIADANLPLSGPWAIALDIRLGRFSFTRLETEFDLP